MSSDIRHGRLIDLLDELVQWLPIVPNIHAAGRQRFLLADVDCHDIPRRDEIRETLDWLDRYLGPVPRK